MIEIWMKSMPIIETKCGIFSILTYKTCNEIFFSWLNLDEKSLNSCNIVTMNNVKKKLQGMINNIRFAFSVCEIYVGVSIEQDI
jgi:hypothetical protein